MDGCGSRLQRLAGSSVGWPAGSIVLLLAGSYVVLCVTGCIRCTSHTTAAKDSIFPAVLSMQV